MKKFLFAFLFLFVGIATISFPGNAEFGYISSVSITIGSTPIYNGTDTQVLFNDAGFINGDTALVWDKTNNALSFGGALDSANSFSLGPSVGIRLEGTANDFETTIGAVDPTADTTQLFQTLAAGTYRITLQGNAALTATRMVFVGASGEVTDDSDCTFATDTLTCTKFVGSNATNLGWTVVAGADTACNTTCTSACVFGWNLNAGNIDGTLLACTDATADACLCAGSS